MGILWSLHEILSISLTGAVQTLRVLWRVTFLVSYGCCCCCFASTSLWFVSLNESAPDSGGWFCRCLSCCQQLVVERSVKRILYKYAQALLHTIPTKRICRSACLRICMRVISMGAAYIAFPCTWCIFNFSSMAAKFSRRKKIPTASSVCCDYWIWALNG